MSGFRFPYCPRNTKLTRFISFACPSTSFLLLLAPHALQLASRVGGAASDPRLMKGRRIKPTGGAPMTEKIVDLWKEWVKRRWNPEAKFLNLEVSDPRICTAAFTELEH